MARRLKIPSLASLARSYQRGVRMLERTAKAQQKALRASEKALRASVLAPAKRKAAATPSRKRAAVGAKAAPKATAVRRASTSARPAASLDARKGPRTTTAAPQLGQWLSGLAPGPAGARRYHLFVPHGVSTNSRTRLPLLVMLHGCGQTGHSFAASTRMNQRAARERFLVLYPEQERVANAQGCWRWFDRRNGRADAEADTLLAAIEQVQSRYAVHPARIAVAGLSAGATMAAWMALRAPGRFCALAMHSGAAPGSAESAASALAALRGERPLQTPSAFAGNDSAGGMGAIGTAPVAATNALPPLLLLHGSVDNVVAPRNAERTAQWWADASAARIGATKTQQRGSRYATEVTQWRANGKAQVVLRKITGLGHAWSGGAARLPYSDPAGPDASALIWAFVARQFASGAQG